MMKKLRYWLVINKITYDIKIINNKNAIMVRNKHEHLVIRYLTNMKILDKWVIIDEKDFKTFYIK
jgi:hypothetical protein